MTFETQTIVNLLSLTALGAGGWFCRMLWDAIHTLRQDLKDIEVMLPNEYIKKTDFSDQMKRIEGMLHRIIDKLDEKADKVEQLEVSLKGGRGSLRDQIDGSNQL